VRREHFVVLRAEPQGIHDNHSAYESITSEFRVNAPVGVVRGGGPPLTVGCGAAQARAMKLTDPYDGLQRLIGAVESPGTSYAYGYDLASNRTSVAVNGGTPATTTYNFANLINDGSAADTYDALSRMTQRGATTCGDQSPR